MRGRARLESGLHTDAFGVHPAAWRTRIGTGTGSMTIRKPNSACLAAALLGLAFISLVGGWLAPFDPLASDVANALQAPSSMHWFGTDQVGRDVLSRVLVATRLDLAMALGAVAASFIVGTASGAVSGLHGGRVDAVVGRSVDLLMAFPLFVVAMA
ncbi:MAG: putative dipeptide transport protein superfamily, rane, partial [Rhizobacter sp.]|nr:putative dipeptide transport protein superfamily, rane [Rhizobacter sp.]